MNSGAYQKACLRTENTPSLTGDAVVDRGLHAAMGICTEVGEFQERSSRANALEELGDILWYVAIGYDAIGVTMPDAVKPLWGRRSMVVLSSVLMDLYKRRLMYGRPLDAEKVNQILDEVYESVSYAAVVEDLDIRLVMERNIAKLRARFPEKYDDRLVVERDLTAEARALEGGS